MRTRLDLHEQLCKIPGAVQVYFRPPSSGMVYPCIIYNLEGDMDYFADNIPYINPKRWSVIVIDENPDSEIPNRLKEQLPYCVFDRTYETDGLNHFVFTLYF